MVDVPRGPSRHMEYDRIQNFQSPSLAERLSAMMQADRSDDTDEQVQLNMENIPSQSLLDEDEFNPATRQIQARLTEYEGDLRSYTRILIWLTAVLTVSLAVFLPAVLLRPSSWCGNGVIELVELCDDGNRNDADGCASNCSIVPGFECWAETDGRLVPAPAGCR